MKTPSYQLLSERLEKELAIKLRGKSIKDSPRLFPPEERSKIRTFVESLDVFFSEERTPTQSHLFDDVPFLELYFHYLPMIEYKKRYDQWHLEMFPRTQELFTYSSEMENSVFQYWTELLILHCVSVNDLDAQRFLNRVMYPFTKPCDFKNQIKFILQNFDDFYPELPKVIESENIAEKAPNSSPA